MPDAPHTGTRPTGPSRPSPRGFPTPTAMRAASHTSVPTVAPTLRRRGPRPRRAGARARRAHAGPRAPCPPAAPSRTGLYVGVGARRPASAFLAVAGVVGWKVWQAMQDGDTTPSDHAGRRVAPVRAPRRRSPRPRPRCSCPPRRPQPPPEPTAAPATRPTAIPTTVPAADDRPPVTLAPAAHGAAGPRRAGRGGGADGRPRGPRRERPLEGGGGAREHGRPGAARRCRP